MIRTDPPRPPAGIPSQAGLRLIVAGVAWLLVICLLQALAELDALIPRTLSLPSNVLGLRDVVALFGWVGLMISGVSVIIVPNHLRVRVRPAFLSTFHLILANVGIAGYLAASWLAPASRATDGFLAAVSVSFFVFGVGVLATVVPFLRSWDARAGTVAPPPAPVDA